MNEKLEKKLMTTVKKKVLKKKIRARIAKGQILPVPALASAGALIAAGFTVVPITAAVVGWQVHRFIKSKKAASAAFPSPDAPPLPEPAQDAAASSPAGDPEAPDV